MLTLECQVSLSTPSTPPSSWRMEWLHLAGLCIITVTSFIQTFRELYLKLTHFVLRINYIACTDLGCTICSQVVWTAMGTSFSVDHAGILLIWFKRPIVHEVRFCQYILLHIIYKLFIDDLFLMWTGPLAAAALCNLCSFLATADKAISLDWSCYSLMSKLWIPLSSW